MALGDEIIIGISINNTMGITGQGYDLLQLVDAAVEAEAMGLAIDFFEGGNVPQREGDLRVIHYLIIRHLTTSAKAIESTPRAA